MTAVLFVAVAALATLIRAVLTFGQSPPSLPWRTLAVNIAGSFLLGLMLGAGWSDRIVLSAAGLGSVTTFSTVAAEAAALIDDGHRRRTMAYVGLTLVVGVAAAWLGLSIGETR